MARLVRIFAGIDLADGSVGVPQNDLIIDQWVRATSDYADPVTRQQDRIQDRFNSLVSEWKENTSYLSSTTDMAIHSAYQQIIGLGQNAVPLILSELQREPNHWFWALMAITGVNPIKAEHSGRILEMTDDWLQWGREQGHI